MKKKIYFGTNLKMYKGNAEVVNYLSELSDLANTIQSNFDIELFVIPSYTTLKDSVEVIKNKAADLAIQIGAQNMNPNDNGQFTGDISPLMLKELDVQLVMIGHSERRYIFKETDQEENEKVLSSLKHGFTTLLCVGETLEQKNYNISDEVLRSQLKVGLHNVKKEQLSKLWIAYEPVWAIGVNGIPATAEYANEKHVVIKQCLAELFGDDANKIPVLYGGSVNFQNASQLIAQPNIDGLFTGRSAWNAKDFYHLMIDTLKTAQLYSNEEIDDVLLKNNGYTDIAKELMNKLGGKENITALTHCATRIRVVPFDESKINKLAIEKIDKVKGVFTITNQYQIIFGKTIVDKIYNELNNLINNN
ncbi:MAG: triose-phosphate isomerase [Lonepinella koalarum]|nr:triose-phosphate isomerase [Lonepinella koalarum]